MCPFFNTTFENEQVSAPLRRKPNKEKIPLILFKTAELRLFMPRGARQGFALGINLREPNKRQQLNFAVGKVTSVELNS